MIKWPHFHLRFFSYAYENAGAPVTTPFPCRLPFGTRAFDAPAAPFACIVAANLDFMLHDPCDITMPRGKSGRFVVVLDPETKKDFYSALDVEGLTFKEWFTRTVSSYIADSLQPRLPGLEGPRLRPAPPNE
jgi:hypothetical protein